MTKKQCKLGKEIASLSNALRGLKITLREERSFRIETVAAFLVLAATAYFKLTLVEVAIIVGIIVLVMSLEVLNSSVERILNASPGISNHNIGTIKDMAAGAVLIGIFGSVVIGILIFLPHLLSIVR